MFIAVALDDTGLATAALLHIEKLRVKPDGESADFSIEDAGSVVVGLQ